jgi:hypothetical protein
MERLKANLLGISQFRDNDLVVQFSKKECNIFDSSGKWQVAYGAPTRLLTIAMVFLVSQQILKFFATRQP